MTQAERGSARYRYRSGSTVSPWMSGEELQTAARNRLFDESADVQMSGHAEWKSAGDIRGLSFEKPPDPEHAQATPVEEEDRLTRFSTLRELMAAFIRQDVEVNIPEGKRFVAATLCAVSSDHFEIIDEDSGERTFIPLHQVRSMVARETSTKGSSYRDNHTLRVELI